MRFRKKKEEMPTKDQLIALAIEILKQGDKPTYAKEKLNELAKGSLDDTQLTDYVYDAARIITNDFSRTIPDLRSEHVTRYQNMVNTLLSIEELDPALIGKPISQGGITRKAWKASRDAKIQACDDCLKAMYQLEIACGILGSYLTIEVNTHFEVKDDKVATSAKYDYSKLSLDQKVRLLELMQKAKVKDDDNASPESVKEATNTDTPNFEEVIAKDESANINQIKKIDLPKATGIKSQDSSLNDVKQRLRDTLRADAANKFQAAGANLDKQELNLVGENE